MKIDIDAIRHPKEKLYGLATLAVGGMLWAALAVIIWFSEDPFALTVIVGLYAVGICLVRAAVLALLRAYMFGHFVMVGPNQFPHIHGMVEDGAKKLGLPTAPATFVYNSSGVMNAFALRLLGKKRYIWLTSALIDGDSDEQLRFVVGHELGHHVAGHLEEIPNLLRWPARLVPFLGAAYLRSREFTCDRVGASLARDLAVSRSALQMLACGSTKLNGQMNGMAFAAQERMIPPVAGFILQIFSGYPRLTKRVSEVTHWLETQGSPQVRGDDRAVTAAA
jgi:Zn-dependent protease with chaperone function